LRQCALLLAGLAACTGSREALSRGQAYYEENQYERALAVWRELERDEASLPAPERSRYAYLRGMTDYRLGFREDARHWLALAKAAEAFHPGGLDPAFRQRLNDALIDLNREVSGRAPESADVIQSIDAPIPSAP
jgi:hypothetical protein